jgi:hypothetical protein
MTVFAAASDRHCATVTSGIDRAIRLSTAAAVLAVAGIAAYVSYWHAYAVVRAHGETGKVRSAVPRRVLPGRGRWQRAVQPERARGARPGAPADGSDRRAAGDPRRRAA